MKLADKLNELGAVIINSDVENFQRIADELYSNASDEKEKDIITKFIEGALFANSESIVSDFNLLKTRAQLLEVEKIISYSYIAKNYFHKSNEWLYQRIRGYNVNGKEAKFSTEELNTLNFAMQDISKKIGSVAFA